MRVLLAAVGKPRNPDVARAIQEYEARAARYWPLAVHEVREMSARGSPPAIVRAREGERLAAVVGAAELVACDVDGRQMTSEAFAAWLQRTREGSRDVAFAIGGAFGLADALLRRAALRLSFSSWTLPHELARLILAEQLYRAGTIVRGEPYHK